MQYGEVESIYVSEFFPSRWQRRRVFADIQMRDLMEDIARHGVRDGSAARGRDIARDFLRIHSVITYALKVSIERSESYAQEGYPDATTRKGFTSYVRCLSALLYAHHITEDDLAFPYFWEKLPDLPVDLLERGDHVAQKPDRIVVSLVDRQPGNRPLCVISPRADQRRFAKPCRG